MMPRLPGPRRAAQTACTLGVLGVCLAAVLARPATLRVQTLTTGRAPDAVVLDPHAKRAFVANDGDGTVSLLDLAALRVLRTVRVGDPSTLAPLALALDPATHHLFVADRGDTAAPSVVQMLDSTTGARLASVRVGYEAGALAVDTRQGHVLVANEADGTLSLLDARSGAVRRTTALGLWPVALAVDERSARAFVLGPAASGALSLPAMNGTAAELLAMLDTRSGALLSLTPVGGGPSTLDVDERSARVFVANSTADTINIFDAHDGTLLRTVTLRGEPDVLAVDERRGRVFVVDARDGTMIVLDAASGALVRTIRVDPTPNAVYPPPYALAVDEAHDGVYLSTWGALTPVAGQGLTLAGAGTLVVLDARTGAVRERITVGVAPQTVAVDGGRVVVVNGGGEVAQGAGWLAQGAQWLWARLPWLGRVAPPPPATERVQGSVSLIEAGA